MRGHGEANGRGRGGESQGGGREGGWARAQAVGAQIVEARRAPSHPLVCLPCPALPWSLQVNGESFATTGAAKVFNVTSGKRYRFRTVQGGSSWALEVAVQGHQLSLIAVDGSPIQPTTAAAFRVTPGERVDFVLAAGEPAARGARPWEQGAAWMGEGDLGAPPPPSTFGSLPRLTGRLRPLPHPCPTRRPAGGKLLDQRHNHQRHGQPGSKSINK